MQNPLWTLNERDEDRHRSWRGHRHLRNGGCTFAQVGRHYGCAT